jgi:hypothetical protein
MQAWTLRDAAGNEIPHPDKGAHWMDFGNAMWAEHWKAQTLKLIAKYGAVGVVASELPLGNSEITDNLANLQKYKTREDLAEATLQWLQKVRSPGAYWLLPSAIGFDGIVGHPTSPLEENLAEPALIGRYWDHFAPFIDGAWCEGWVQPYWTEFGLPSDVRDMHLAVGNRASRNGQLLIATAAYRNDGELETLLAHYLLVSHKQGDFVFQPMPIQAGAPPEAGLSLKVFREEVKRKAAYLQIPLGSSLDEKLYVRAENGAVWKRRFQNGMVYLNPADTHAVRLTLGGGMRRIGETETKREIELAPRSGVILLFTEPSGAKK